MMKHRGFIREGKGANLIIGPLTDNVQYYEVEHDIERAKKDDANVNQGRFQRGHRREKQFEFPGQQLPPNAWNSGLNSSWNTLASLDTQQIHQYSHRGVHNKLLYQLQ
jgi:hypothetical protein